MNYKIPFTDSDLPVNTRGRIYHLDLEPQELAAHIIIVGDPERVPLIADSHLKGREVDRSHRGLRTITGVAKATDRRVSIVTSGMGTPSLEVVLQEIVALHEVNFTDKTHRKNFNPLSIIRVGTSGGLQADTELGTPIITHYAVGLDNTGLFYDAPCPDRHCVRIETELHTLLTAGASSDSRFKARIYPYLSKSNDQLSGGMHVAAGDRDIPVKSGLTASSSGFFANQGRDVTRIKPTVRDIDRLLAGYDPGLSGLKVENMEMEASFLLHFMNSLGHRAACICPAIANRAKNTFASTAAIQAAVHTSTELALYALSEPG